MTLIQTKLKQGTIEKVVWLPVDPRVKVGSKLTLKDEPDNDEWEVIEQFDRQDSENIQRGWGLDLPKTQRTER